MYILVKHIPMQNSLTDNLRQFILIFEIKEYIRFVQYIQSQISFWTVDTENITTDGLVTRLFEFFRYNSITF